ncbi:MAG TPA: group 1 truncated hemoglobin, partial [Bacteroidia bacterium]|nr:group 1 truncated hemoglobin [Bacteroidia bacterium]
GKRLWQCNLYSCRFRERCDDDKETMTLYDSLGGTKMVADPVGGAMIEQGRLGIRSVVDSTIFVIAADTQLNTKFFSVLLAEVGAGNLTGFNILSKNLTDFFCVATGAKNYTYNGLDMVSAHNPATHSRIGSKINNAEFDRFVADLVTGAQKVGLSNQLIGQVGALVETTRSQVVQN